MFKTHRVSKNKIHRSSRGYVQDNRTIDTKDNIYVEGDAGRSNLLGNAVKLTEEEGAKERC
jgi:hypothetical protein